MDATSVSDSTVRDWRDAFCAYVRQCRSAIPDLVRRAEGSLEFFDVPGTKWVGIVRKRPVQTCERYVGWRLTSWQEPEGRAWGEVRIYLLHDGRLLQAAGISGSPSRVEPISDRCFADHFATSTASGDLAALEQGVRRLFEKASLDPPLAPGAFPADPDHKDHTDHTGRNSG
jgi:hypothetical protein